MMTKDSNLDIIQKWHNAINDTPSIQDKIKQSGAKSEKEYYEQYATEQEFLNWYHQQEHNNYPKPSLTVDLIGLRWNSRTKTVQILLVQRKNHPFKDHWALPGGFVQENESINDAIIRETFEETHIQIKESDQIAGLPNIIRLPAVLNSMYQDFKSQWDSQARVIMIRSQSGKPIATFVGDHVSIHNTDMKNTTKFVIDGHRLIAYRCDYTIYPMNSVKKSTNSQETN